MKGQVFKVMADQFDVYLDNGNLLRCKARGILKSKRDMGISVGDYCQVEDGVITKIFDRKNKFIRPNVSNVDVVLIVCAVNPEPDYLLIDKVIINAINKDVEVIIAVNKCDQDSSLFDKINKEYSPLNVKVLKTSTISNYGMDNLKRELKGKTVVFAGQSAVGKTSIVNSIFNLNLKTGDLSEKIVRGKHTTTYSQIFIKDDIKVVDSPGFASIDADLISFEDLKDHYIEYVNLADGCRFRGCNHINEPDCAVKNAVEKGELSLNRYNRYKEIYSELKERRDKNYGKN